MGRTVRIQEIVGRRAVIDEGLVGDQAGLRLGLGRVASAAPDLAIGLGMTSRLH